MECKPSFLDAKSHAYVRVMKLRVYCSFFSGFLGYDVCCVPLRDAINLEESLQMVRMTPTFYENVWSVMCDAKSLLSLVIHTFFKSFLFAHYSPG